MKLDRTKVSKLFALTKYDKKNLIEIKFKLKKHYTVKGTLIACPDISI